MEDKLKGYKGKSIDILKKYTSEIWDIIQITTNKTQLSSIASVTQSKCSIVCP